MRLLRASRKQLLFLEFLCPLHRFAPAWLSEPGGNQTKHFNERGAEIMTITRTLTVFSLTIAALMTMESTAKADKLQDIFRTVRKVQADFGGSRQALPRHGGQHGQQFLPPGGGCHKQICPPPPPPPCVKYCVYYYSCHCGWKLYGCYRSHWQANQAERQLQYDGYRTYIRVKRLGGHVPHVR
jgi:hypothetical protein